MIDGLRIKVRCKENRQEKDCCEKNSKEKIKNIKAGG